MRKRIHLGAAIVAAALGFGSLPAASAGADGTAFQAVFSPAPQGGTLLYLADADTNAPVTGAMVEIEAPGWQGQATAEPGEGTYRIEWTPPSDGADVTVMIVAGNRDDLILVGGVGRVEQVPVAEPPAISHTHWAAMIGGGIGLLVVGLVLGMRRRKAWTAAVAGLAMVMLSPDAFAHSGHDHGAQPDQQPAPQPGALLTMAKPTQFLLGIRTSRVEPREAADSIRVVGRVVPDPAGFAKVQSSQPSRVVSDPAFPLPVPGQPVKRGQVVAVLEPTLTTLERSDHRSALYRIESEIAIQERELARQESLGAVVPAKTVETSRIRLQQLRREKAQIAGTALGRDLVVAPVDGVVTDVHVVPGEVVTPEKVMVEIVDPARLRIEAVVHDLTVADKVSGAHAATRLRPGQSFDLTLLGVSPRIDAIDQGVHAVFSVSPHQAPQLKIGLPVDVYLATGATRLATSVPRDAVTEMAGRQVVFVRTAPETFEARPVTVKSRVGPLAEVEGVRAGERVVVQGVEQIRAAR